MAIDPEELEEIPPQGHVRVVYTGPVAPHWEIHRVFGDQRAIDEFRQRAMARLVLLPPKGNGVAVLVQVAAPEQFVDNLRRIWSHRL